MTGKVDPEHTTQGKPFDNKDGYFGEDYDRTREAAMGRADPSGSVAQNADDADPDAPDNGTRAWADPHTGEVHGSGTGAGGGERGDEIDEVDPATPPGTGRAPIN